MKSIVLTQRDRNILKFLWKWKLVTTSALTQAFFSDRSPVTAYVRLWHLKKANFIQLTSEPGGTAHYWTLAQKGFLSVRGELCELAEDGFRTENLKHDHLVTAIHLGEWLLSAPAGVELFSEQELRRFYTDHYPDWAPKTNNHRPDGYWRVPRKGKELTIALEVEINLKRDRFYRQLAHFYDQNKQVDRVIWLTQTKRNALTIQKLLQAEVGASSIIHNFVTLSDFEKEGWFATVLAGAEEKKTLAFLLDPSLQTTSKPVWTRFLLDTRKCPFRSKSYEKFLEQASFDRVVSPSNLIPETL